MTSKIKKGGVILIGYGILCFGMLLVGPSKLLGLYNSPAFIILGLAIVGFGGGMIIIPIIPEMIDAAEEAHPDIEEEELNNNVAGICIGF